MPSLSRRKVIIASVGVGSVAAIGAALGLRRLLAGGPAPVVRSTQALGSAVSITAVHPDPVVADDAITAAFKELEQVEAVLSIYRPDSQVSRLNRTGQLDNAHPYLAQVLDLSLQLSQRSSGAFDVTVQPLWHTYLEAYKQGRLPTDRELDDARGKVGWRRVERSEGRIQLSKQGMALTFNGIAQGFALDRVKAVLQSHGIEQAMLDVGELAALGRKSVEEPWQAGIQHPREADAFVAVVPLGDRSLATSGDYETLFTKDRVHHHILDPQTGRSPAELASVSILAPSGMLADGLSTACFVMGFDAGPKFAAKFENVDALFVTKDGREHASPGFPRAAAPQA